jgi:penicillin amidase
VARRQRLLISALTVAVTLAGAGLLGWRAFTRRALPRVSGQLRAPGLSAPVTILRDAYGVPHIFAEGDADAYFALGYLHAQDRLFQLDLLRHLTQGRLAELFGARALRSDRLFRTLDLHGTARRRLARARPEAQAALMAYAKGVNAAVDALAGRLPPEFTLLGHTFEPVQADDFVAVVGYMTWGLNMSWHFDPLFEDLAAKLGRARAAELFPYNFGAQASVHPGPAGAGAAAVSQPAVAGSRAARTHLPLFALEPQEWAWLGPLQPLRGSNNWVVAPGRSASGHALLANDPHLTHGLPGIWYEAHLKSRTQDVLGVTVPGLPLVIIGRNRDIAWGFTNVMLDAADFFVERLDPSAERVMYRGQWVALETRQEVLRIEGGGQETLTVRSSPHGPLVGELLEPATRHPLAYQWTYNAATSANELDGFFALDRARDWPSFRAALAQFGAVAQNVAYADRQGHIGMQTTGAIPRLTGVPDGSGLRIGWDGSQEWDGFVPFEELPATFDPPAGFLVSANNPTFPPGAPYYISSQWEPTDRFARIREWLEAHPRVTVADMQALQSDVTWVTGRALAARLLKAFDEAPPSGTTAAALALLHGWDGAMRTDSAAATVMATFYKHLFHALLADEFGPELAARYRGKGNVSAIMMQAVLFEGRTRWCDRTDTPATESCDDVLRLAFERAVDESSRRLSGRPSSWTWGRLHTLELRHPLGRASWWLARYFNRGPVALAGHTSTVAKAEFPEQHFEVEHGPSMRQITDFADLDSAWAVLPAGQSGLPASKHYDDMAPLWRAGRYHSFPIQRPAVEALARARLVLTP